MDVQAYAEFAVWEEGLTILLPVFSLHHGSSVFFAAESGFWKDKFFTRSALKPKVVVEVYTTYVISSDN